LFSSQLEDLAEQIDIQTGENEVVIRLMGESTFNSGKADIRSRMIPLLEKVADVIRSADGDLIIAGHTDNVPIRSGGLYRTNLRLSTARASAVAEFFIARSRIDPKRISTMGFGEYRPIETNETASGRQKNRRVEIILGNLPKTKPHADPQS